MESGHGLIYTSQMTDGELRSMLQQILRLEEQPAVDWLEVYNIAVETIRRLVNEPAPEYPHNVVFRFLDDADVRQKDADYASFQRERLREWLNAAG